jgi:hypothetical protein
MTLKELIDNVCTKVHRNDAPARAEARTYIKNRHRILYESRIWRDAIDPPLLLSGRTLTNEFGEPLTDENGNIITAGLVDQILILPAIVSRVINCRWGTDTVLQNEELWNMIRLNPSIFDQTGDPIGFSVTSPSGTLVSPGGLPLVFTTSSVDAVFDVTVRGRLRDVDQNEVVRVTGGGSTNSVNSYDHISSLGKETLEANLTVTDSLGTTLLNLPADEGDRRHQRIHFHSTPRNPGTLMILYKRKCKDLIHDSDSTEIEGFDNMLLAAAITDMREGERQISKAAAKAQEVQALMQVAIDLEKEQSASMPRLIPDPGDGWDLPGKGYW